MKTSKGPFWMVLAGVLVWVYLALQPEAQVEVTWVPPAEEAKQTSVQSYAPAQASVSSSPITVTNMTIGDEKMKSILANYPEKCYSPSIDVVHFDNWICIKNDFGGWDAQRY